jgi:hypothetical protein
MLHRRRRPSGSTILRRPFARDRQHGSAPTEASATGCFITFLRRRCLNQPARGAPIGGVIGRCRPGRRSNRMLSPPDREARHAWVSTPSRRRRGRGPPSPSASCRLDPTAPSRSDRLEYRLGTSTELSAAGRRGGSASRCPVTRRGGARACRTRFPRIRRRTASGSAPCWAVRGIRVIARPGLPDPEKLAGGASRPSWQLVPVGPGDGGQPCASRRCTARWGSRGLHGPRAT